MADIVMIYNLYYEFGYILTKSFTKDFPHLVRYYWTLGNQPNFKKVIGEVKQAESVPQVAKKEA